MKSANVYHLFVMFADEQYTVWSFDVLATSAQDALSLLSNDPINHIVIDLLRSNVGQVPADFIALSMANMTTSQALAWANR